MTNTRMSDENYKAAIDAARKAMREDKNKQVDPRFDIVAKALARHAGMDGETEWFSFIEESAVAIRALDEYEASKADAR